MRYHRRSPVSAGRGGGSVQALRTFSLGLAAVCLLYMLHLLSTQNNRHGLNDSILLTGNSGTLTKVKMEDPAAVASRRRRPQVSFSPWEPNVHTLKDFTVAGVNLAKYRIKHRIDDTAAIVDPNAKPFELYNDFDIDDKIRGDEDWSHLIKQVRRQLERPSLIFYMDKVCQKRWLPKTGVNVTGTFVSRYAYELTTTGNIHDEKEAIYKLIPKNENYVVKPTHKANSAGVYVVKYDESSGITSIGKSGRPLEQVSKRSEEKYRIEIVKSLARDLHEDATSHESWALNNAKPGLLIEQRFTSWERDDLAAVEFKVFTIWGRVHVGYWKRGIVHNGVVYRNGSSVICEDTKMSLPGWVDFARVVEIAEKLGAHKDMFRVDVFAGVPAGSPAMRPDATNDDRLAAVEYVVSEVEIHPTSYFHDEKILEESARLWLAGYKIGNYRIVPNTEVPKEFLETFSLPMTKE